MKKVVMMSEEEYSNIINKIAYLETKIEDMEMTSHFNKKRFNALWNNVNRPAIEASAEEGENDFYSWCDRVAKKYEEKDYNEWLLERAKWYNNGLLEYATSHGCKNVDDVHEDWRWDCGYNCYISDEHDNEPTEGWSELFARKDVSGYKDSDYLDTLFWAEHYDRTAGEWDLEENRLINNSLASLVEGGIKWRW